MATINLYEEEIKSELEVLANTQVGTEEYEKTVNGLTKLTQTMIDLKKVDTDQAKIEIEHRKIDVEEAKVEMEKKDKKHKNAIAIGTTGLTIGAGIWAAIYSWKKEEVGTMTFTAGRKAIDFLLGGLKKH